MFATYVLLNKNNKIYIGHTANLKLRVMRHNKKLPYKKTAYTYKHGLDWKVVYVEYFETRQKAKHREKELKFYQGRQWIRSQIIMRSW